MKPPNTQQLPLPDAAAAAHSHRLAGRIRDEIAAAPAGRIPFARYMELALYAPGLGYYSAGSQKFGERGDFVTAPELSPLFARCLAHQCAQVLAETGGALLEFGAGSGALASGLLTALADLGALPSAYFILEVSADLRVRQAEAVAALDPALAARVQWLDRLPAGFRGVVVANEVIDAMPVHRFRMVDGVAREVWVTAAGDGFRETLADPAEARVAARLAALAARGLPDGFAAECNLAADDWVAALGGMLEVGAAFIIDYGFPAAEYYHPQRAEGTLMCHYRHRAHGDPYFLPGLQDITAHVDFTALAEAALAAGLAVAGYTSQANFLLATGITEALAAAAGDDPRRQLALAATTKKLLMPHEMGELFKVMALTRGVDGPLQGFALRDERGRL